MNFIKIALNVIDTEVQAIANLTHYIDESFQNACELILNCSGKLIVTGVGKSGLIGKKIAATFSSTGTPSIFLHPTEALHRDFGMIQSNDVVLAISHSGYTDELCKLLPALTQKNIAIIALTGRKNSPLALSSQVVLHYGNAAEACPLGLAPTTSTTLTLVMGDCLAVALLDARKFNEKDFASNHPGGNLGRKLMNCMPLAHQGAFIPKVFQNTCVLDSLIEISNKKLGMTCIVNEHSKLVGILTDGDIRRTLITKGSLDGMQVHQIMSHSPITISEHTLATDAFKIMQQNAITSLIIIDEHTSPIGILHIHDLLKAGFENQGAHS